ncbi:MAG: hypothetical protein DME23_09560 [Verrucomicrobia bacterium]|nr:MAG: hypothetical protein DME23_09560 [Verrucomicrobiota bacterium]
MHDEDSLAKALANVPVRELQATLVRRVPLGPLVESPVPDFLFTSGKAYRYNTRGIHCVYFAEDERTAVAEYERHNVSRHQPFVTYFAEVVLKRIIDLCSTETVKALGLKPRDLRAPWVGARRPTVTQLLGKALNSGSVAAAIRFPSEAARAQRFAGAKVVVFQDCVRRPDFVRILGPTKKPLQRWPD